MAAVLVVEDEDVLLDMIAALVEDIGHRALLATNGRAGLAMLHAEPELPLLIISDVMMPLMNGIAFAKAVKADPRYCQVPLVLMSAAGQSEAKALADHFIAKPFELDEIEQLIEQYTRDGISRNIH